MRINKFNGSFLSLFFSGVVATGIIVAIFAKTLPFFAAKAIYYCQQFISNTLTSNTLFQIPHTLHHFLILALIVSLVLGILSFSVQLVKTHGLLTRLLAKRVGIPNNIQRTIAFLGLGGKVYLIKDDNLFSLCFGIVSPRIIITTALVYSLTNKELEAVILHEQSHVQNHDPFKILLGKTVTSMFFFLPIFSQLNKNMNATSELVADQWAITAQRGTMFLRGALKKILSRPQVTFATVPAISNPDNLEIRISKLTNKTVQRGSGISLASIITSLLFLLLSWFILRTPVSVFSMEHSKEPSYFLCSSDNACSEQCAHNAQMSPVSSPEQLFTSGDLQYRVPFL
ncbi:MAG: M56 family metallopeptidase [Patescibacteria group bacterium]